MRGSYSQSVLGCDCEEGRGESRDEGNQGLELFNHPRRITILTMLAYWAVMRAISKFPLSAQASGTGRGFINARPVLLGEELGCVIGRLVDLDMDLRLQLTKREKLISRGLASRPAMPTLASNYTQIAPDRLQTVVDQPRMGEWENGRMESARAGRAVASDRQAVAEWADTWRRERRGVHQRETSQPLLLPVWPVQR